MEKIIEKFLKEKNLLDASRKFVIGFSGGYDSMAMVYALIKLSKKYGFKIILAHLNHNWRGEISTQEAINCENFARQHNLDFYTETLPDDIPHTETVAREERYKFFDRAAKKYHTDKIFTAHTKSDNIETVLQRIIKGTGVAGLCGIHDERKLNSATVYRPILECTRANVLEFCEKNNLAPNNDNSNTDTKYLRNRIREKLLPDLKKNYDNNAESAIFRLIQNAKDNEELINELAKDTLKNLYDEDEMRTFEFIKLSVPMKRRVVKDLLETNGFDYDRKRIFEIIDFIEENKNLRAGKTLSLGRDKWLFVSDSVIKFLNKDSYNNVFAQKEVNMDGETCLEEFDAVVKISKWTGEAPKTFPNDTDSVIYADFSGIEMPLTFRPWVFGDVIVPFGKNSPIKLKKYFNNKGASKHEKSKVLLISSPKEVLWVINMGISNNIRVTNMPTHKVEFYIRSEHE